jgi:starch synthase
MNSFKTQMRSRKPATRRPGAIVGAGAHPHFYDVALAAQEAGYPGRLYTVMYWKPNSLADWLLRLPAFVRHRLPAVERLRGRRKADLDPDRVCPVAHAELVHRVRTRLVPPALLWRAHRWLFDRYVARHLQDTDCVVHGSWGSSHQTFVRAKQLGVKTILDVPYIGPEELKALWVRESQHLGLAADVGSGLHDGEIHHFTAEIKLADVILVGTERYRRSALLAGGADEKIRLVPYGFDTTRFTYIERPRRPTFTVLYVGPINPTKGLHYLLEAFDRAAISNSILHLVGRIDPATASYFAPAIRQLGSRVVHEGWVLHAELERVYASADVFAFPSMVGGIGVAVCEAMATGLPVITSDGDVVLRHGIDGLVVGERDVDGLIAALRALAADYEQRKALGVSASQRVKLFTREGFRRALAEVYASTLAVALDGMA